MTASEWRAVIVSTLALCLCALLPWYDRGYLLAQATTIAMFVVLATSWALFSGPTHYISLATAAFFGLGSYVTGLGFRSVPLWLLPFIAAGLGACLAAAVGWVTLRLSGVYFVIFTLGLAELVRQIVTWVQNQTGQRGMYVLTSLSEAQIYWQLLVLATIVFLLGWLIGRSRLGFALRVIGNDEVVARHVGIDTARTKIALFTIPGAVAAATGAVVAPRYIYIDPGTAFAPILSFQVVIMALLGGTGRLWGPLAGVVPFMLLWEVMNAQAPNHTLLLLGATFLFIVYVLPGGFVGLWERARYRWRQP